MANNSKLMTQEISLPELDNVLSGRKEDPEDTVLSDLQGNLPLVVVIGEKIDFLELAKNVTENFRIVFFEKIEEVLKTYPVSSIAVVIAFHQGNQDNPSMNSGLDASLHILSHFDLESRMTSRILVVPSVNSEIMARAINESHVHSCYSFEEFKEKWAHTLSHCLKKYRISYRRYQILKDSTRKIREIESLNSNLELVVQERTRHIELSKIEEDEKLSRGRNLIKFIKELSTVLDLETLIKMIRKEFRKFHKISDPILVYKNGSDLCRVIYLNSSQVFTLESSNEFSFNSSSGIVGSEMSQQLANIMGRPFGRIFNLPLDLQFVKAHIFSDAAAALIWEVQLSETELGQFRNMILDRFESIAITVDRVMLENDLIQFSYRWEKTFDGFRDPIAIVNSNYEVLRSNKKFSDRYDQRPCYQKFAKKDSPCENCPVERVTKEGTSQVSEMKIHDRTIEVHSYPILLEGGRSATHVVNQYIDVTQERELYLRMLQSEKIGAIGLLAGHIAHELNNPLSGIRSLAQVLLASGVDAGLKSDLEEIEKATHRSQKIIRNLLDFSSDSSGEERAVTWEALIEKTAPMLKTALRSHRWKTDLQTQGATFKAEPQLMQQVYFNLVNNACQAMKSIGTVTIKTEVKQNYISLKVSDTGSGISEDAQKKIFEPFFTTKKEGLGTGLGLSLSKKIVEKFGGEIQLDTTSPEGTTFQVKMPIYQRLDEGT